MSGAWDFDCAVIGGGPGGLVAAMYLRRFRRSVALVNAGKPRAAWIPRTHNLIGFPRGISGVSLLRRLNHQVNALAAERFRARARVTALRGGGFAVEHDTGTLKARAVILATGVEDAQPDVPNLVELRKSGLLRYCSVCDAYDHRGMKLAVLASDSAGLGKALFLAPFARRLEVIVPRELDIAPITRRRLRQVGARLHPGDILAIERTRGARGLHIELDRGQGVDAQAAYVELGCRVRDDAFAAIRGIHRTKEGFISATTEGRAGIPGLFAVGDCVNLLAQISVAAGQAAVAATTIHNDLLEF